MCSIIKRIIDLILAILVVVLASPLLLLIALAIKLGSPGPVLYRQGRLGKNAEEFEMVKFRTMVEGAEKMDEGLFNYADDPRVTKVGNLLRNTSLDELGQLLNILKGDMSIVGPRPPVSYELGDVSNFDKRTMKRFAVKPGITGLAQVSGRNALSWDEKIEFDNQYVDDWRRLGVLADIPILFRTLFIVFSNTGAHEDHSNREQDAARQNRQSRIEDE
ncbi:MAG: sugar transferase [Pseudomonadota bacterium]